jgi:hypothetical protein
MITLRYPILAFVIRCGLSIPAVVRADPPVAALLKLHTIGRELSTNWLISRPSKGILAVETQAASRFAFGLRQATRSLLRRGRLRFNPPHTGEPGNQHGGDDIKAEFQITLTD